MKILFQVILALEKGNKVRSFFNNGLMVAEIQEIVTQLSRVTLKPKKYQ